MGTRSVERGNAAVRAIKAEHKNADITIVKMDMMDLKSMVGAAEEIKRFFLLLLCYNMWHRS